MNLRPETASRVAHNLNQIDLKFGCLNLLERRQILDSVPQQTRRGPRAPDAGRAPCLTVLAVEIGQESP